MKRVVLDHFVSVDSMILISGCMCQFSQLAISNRDMKVDYMNVLVSSLLQDGHVYTWSCMCQPHQLVISNADVNIDSMNALDSSRQ